MTQTVFSEFSHKEEKPAPHILSVIVDNEPGVLMRVIGLFAARGYNIESLTVSETQHLSHVSRITIVTCGTMGVLEQIKAQLERMVPVHSVLDLSVEGEVIERELALIKVSSQGASRSEILGLSEAFRARVVDATLTSFVLEVTGKSSKIEQFIDLMSSLGLVEVVRTGVTAIRRGAQAMES